jgi:hypothetical protein
VRRFVDTVDEKLPSLGDEHPSTRQEIIDAGLVLADQLVHTQYGFLREQGVPCGTRVAGNSDFETATPDARVSGL